MNLKYSILWFEDQMDSMEPLVDDIKEFVESIGFKFSDPRVESNGSNFDSLRHEDYDLILMDYKLSNHENGDSLIERIRNHQIYTDIIFYSSSTVLDLRKAIHDKGLDGVYCVSRTAEAFLAKVKSIIESTVKKVLDLNNMRGLVMAEVSDCDEKMKQIISLYVKKYSGEKADAFISDRKTKLMESISSKLCHLEKQPSEQLFDSRDFDASHRWRAVKNITKTEATDREACTTCYENEIIKKRNHLGHVVEITNDAGEKCLAYGDFVFNDESCRQILTDLKKHSDNFDAIILQLQS